VNRWILSEGGSNLKASILMVEDDPGLLRTRAELLRDWQITTASSREAAEAMRARTYDLLIFSQTMRESLVRSLIAQAMEQQPNVRILAIRSGVARRLELPTYQVDLGNPGGLRSAVARMLDDCDRNSFDYMKASAIPSNTISR
jgi:hypothetical protein